MHDNLYQRDCTNLVHNSNSPGRLVLELAQFARRPRGQLFGFGRLRAATLGEETGDGFAVEELEHVGAERRAQVSDEAAPARHHLLCALLVHVHALQEGRDVLYVRLQC